MLKNNCQSISAGAFLWVFLWKRKIMKKKNKTKRKKRIFNKYHSTIRTKKKKTRRKYSYKPIKKRKNKAVKQIKIIRVEIPEIAMTVDYEMIFKSNPPSSVEERIALIKHIPKINLISELASLNYRLRKFDESEYKYDSKTQYEELLYFCGEDVNVYETYRSEIIEYFKSKGYKNFYPVIFNRATNLFALQEIILYGSDIPSKGFKMQNVWEDILKYYFAINSITSAYKSENEVGFSNLQKLTAGHAFLDTLHVTNSPLLAFERFPIIIEYLRNEDVLNKYFASHFKPYGFDPEEYLFYIAELYFNLYQKNIPTKLACFYHVPTDDKKRLDILTQLSSWQKHFIPKHDFDLTNLKKYPFYKESETQYILLDFDFLIEKVYHFFINDYYFDYLKPNENIGYDYYASKIGYFFENYVSSILKKSLHKKEITVKTLDELKSNIKGSEIELADFYIRENNRIILGQIKASALNNEQNEGTAEKLFSQDKNFLKDFGLNQTFDSIEYLNKFPKEFDRNISEEDKQEIYPVIVLNDLLASSIVLPMLFQSELTKFLSNKKYPHFIFYPITIIHIQDLERMSSFLESEKIDIWTLLNKNSNASLPKPFYITLDRFRLNEVKLKSNEYKFAKFIGLR